MQSGEERKQQYNQDWELFLVLVRALLCDYEGW